MYEFWERLHVLKKIVYLENFQTNIEVENITDSYSVVVNFWKLYPYKYWLVGVGILKQIPDMSFIPSVNTLVCTTIY